MSSQKILIIDDSKAIRMQVKEMLPKGGIEVLEAGDGVEGLELIHAAAPNIVLLDFFMPRMTGLEVIQQIQTHPKLKSLPVVLMSGRREDVEQQVPNLEHFEFIGKPFEQPILIQAIKSAMLKAKNRQQVAATGATATSPSPVKPAGDAHLIQSLQAEIQGLRRENAALRTEFEALKKQVNQIIAFMRQKAKS